MRATHQSNGVLNRQNREDPRLPFGHRFPEMVRHELPIRLGRRALRRGQNGHEPVHPSPQCRRLARLVSRPEVHRLGRAKRIGYRSPVRGCNNKLTAGNLTSPPHCEAPLTRRGRSENRREGPVGKLRHLRRRRKSGPSRQRETPVIAGAPRRQDRLDQRAGVPHKESAPILSLAYDLDPGEGHSGVIGQTIVMKLGVKGRGKVEMLALVRAPRLVLGRSFR
mmetsp:Transcript_54475/g.124140  ORF Transcript_54475/g.124140 Transcript_54475/m.124140 type:complete len:222 (-) Transcript_54475:571-1236(-)